MKPGYSKFSRPTTSKKQQKPVKKSVPTIENDNLSELLQQLISQQKQCERKGKYVEADQYKKKVKALKEEADKMELAEIKKKHQQQRQQIQQAHLEEMNCFNIQWDEKIQQLQRNVNQMEAQLAARHEEQSIAIQEELLSEKPVKFKQSAQLLNLRRIQQQLAKRQDYLEAHKVQNRAQKLEKQELQKWKREQGSKCRSSLSLLRKQQQADLSALKQRIDLMFEQKLRQRGHEQQKIILKFQNVMKQLEFQQKQEFIRFQKACKLANAAKKTKVGQFSTSKVSIS